MITELQIDYMEKALDFQAKGDRYSYLEYLVDTEMKLLRKERNKYDGIQEVAKRSELEESIKRLNEMLPLKRRTVEEEGNGSHEQHKHPIKRPRTVLLQKGQRIEKPPPLTNEFKKAVEDKQMGILGNELRRIEEAEKRSREEVLVASEILNSLKKATPFRVVCDQKQQKTETPPSSSSSQPQPQPQPRPQHKKLKGIRFVARASSVLPFQSTPPEIPVKIQEAIKLLRGTPPVWLTQKTLTGSDIEHGLGRLFIPTCETLEQFMTDEEKRAALVTKKKKQINNKGLGGAEKEKEIGMNVVLVNPMGDQIEISFRKWPSLKKCVFTKTWNSVIEKFNLKPNRDIVQLWCFRLPVERDSKLCFAMNIKNPQLGDVVQPRERVISNCIEPSFDNFEARPLKKHCSVLIEAFPQEEYRAVAAKAEKEWSVVKHV